MTDLNRPSDDELVSAVLDGEATAEERARVEADSGLRRRLEDFRQISVAVASPPPTTSDAQRDALLAAALAASVLPSSVQPEVKPETEAGTDSGADVIPFERSRRMPPNYLIGIAAAAVVLLLLAAPLALRDSGRGARDTQTAAAPTTIDDTAGRLSEAQDAAEPPETARLAGEDESFADPSDPLTAEDMGGAADTSVVTDSATTPSLPATGTTEYAIVTLGDFDSREDATLAVTAAVVEARDADRAGPGLSMTPAMVDGDAFPCIEDLIVDDPELDALVWAGAINLPDGEHQLLLFRLTPSLGNNGDYRLYETLVPDCAVVSEDTLD